LLADSIGKEIIEGENHFIVCGCRNVCLALPVTSITLPALLVLKTKCTLLITEKRDS